MKKRKTMIYSRRLSITVKTCDFDSGYYIKMGPKPLITNLYMYSGDEGHSNCKDHRRKVLVIHLDLR